MSNTYPHYSMDIRWSDEDQAFIVSIPELPGCVTHGFTYEEAAKNGREVLELWLDILKEDGDPLPEPRAYAVVAG